MTQLSQQTTIFSKPGRDNTDTVLNLVKQRAAELGIKNILIATTTGATGARAADELKGCNLIAVSHSAGFVNPNQQELLPEHVKTMQDKNVHLLTAQHAFGGVNRAIRKMLHTYEVDEIIAYTLRLFGQGMKVVVEIALMAADAGLVDVETPCICIGGTGRGADTAVVLLPSNAQTFFDLQIQEIICRPSPGHPGFEDEA
ncbi:MAG: hypothetical protein JEZ00_08005 [Anaerolineaceae bacterium]|nr:hypothetical protein [Anaerolineaceae bacterium]